MKKFSLFLRFTIIILLFSFSCSKPAKKLKINLEVKTQTGDPLSNAEVIFDERYIGETDARGYLVTELSVDRNQDKKIKIVKTSNIYMFKSYEKWIPINNHDLQSANIKAEIYYEKLAWHKNGGANDTYIKTKDSKSYQNFSVIHEEEKESFQYKLSEEEKGFYPKKREDIHLSPEINDRIEKQKKISYEKNFIKKINKSIDKYKIKVFVFNSKSKKYSKKEIFYHGFASNKNSPIFENKESEFLRYRQGVEKVEIMYATDSMKEYVFGCVTDSEGLCEINLEKNKDRAINLIAIKNGYKSAKIAFDYLKKFRVDIPLENGYSLDFFAIKKTFGIRKGLSHIPLKIGKNFIGLTDKFGHIYFHYEKKDDSMFVVTVNAKGLIPEIMESDFLGSHPIKLVRFFTDKNQRDFQVYSSPLTFKWLNYKKIEMDKLILWKRFIENKIGKEIFRIGNKNIDKKNVYRYPFSGDSFKKICQLNESSGESSDLIVGLETRIIFDSEALLNLTYRNCRGEVLAGIIKRLEKIQDKKNLKKQIIFEISRASENLPFEGAIIDTRGNEIIVNGGKNSAFRVKELDILEVFGFVVNESGSNEVYKKIGELEVKKITDEYSICSPNWIGPRASLSIGDIVKRKKHIDSDQMTFTVWVKSFENGMKSHIENADVYRDGVWVGNTKTKGYVTIEALSKSNFFVLKDGYRIFFGDFTKYGSKTISAFLHPLKDGASYPMNLNEKNIIIEDLEDAVDRVMSQKELKGKVI